MAKRVDEQTVRLLKRALMNGLTRDRAARAAGVGSGTVRRLCAEAREGAPRDSIAWKLYTAVRDAESRHQRRLLARIEKAGRTDGKYWQANAWILERRYPDEWGRRVGEFVRQQLDDMLTVLRGKLPEETFAQVASALLEAKQSARERAGRRAEVSH